MLAQVNRRETSRVASIEHYSAREFAGLHELPLRDDDKLKSQHDSFRKRLGARSQLERSDGRDDAESNVVLRGIIGGVQLAHGRQRRSIALRIVLHLHIG